MNRELLIQPECVQEAGSWCARVYRLTDNDVLARYADDVVGSGLQILFILLLAVLVRLLLHRAIHRLAEATANGGTGRRRWVPRRRWGRAATAPRRDPDKDPDKDRDGGPDAPHSGDQDTGDQDTGDQDSGDQDSTDSEPQTPAGESAAQVKVRADRRAARSKAIGSVLRSATTLVVYGVAATMVLSELGIDLAPILASAGIVGLALGFGAQNLVRDFLSGMFMMTEDQYGVGDWVDLGEASGTVEAVGMRVTTVRDIHGTLWYVRNGEIARVGNASQGHSVAVLNVPIAHHADVAAALAVAERVGAELTEPDGALHGDALAPPEVLGVESIDQQCVNLRITVKVQVGRQYAVQRALLAAILGAFAEAGVPAPLATDARTAPQSNPGPLD